MNAETAMLPALLGCVCLASFLPSRGCEHHVFRVALLSIVFSLAVGQNVSVLCRTWCDEGVTAASECHHKNSPTRPTVAGDENCDSVLMAATAVLRGDERREVSVQNAQLSVPVLRPQLAHLTVGPRPAYQAGRERSLERRPLSTALRI